MGSTSSNGLDSPRDLDPEASHSHFFNTKPPPGLLCLLIGLRIPGREGNQVLLQSVEISV